VLSLPDQADSLALLLDHIGRGGREVLLGHDQSGSGVEIDDVARIGTEIDDAVDPAARGCLVCAGRRVGRREPDLLGSDGEGPWPAEDRRGNVARQQVGRAHEPRHEPGRRSFVDLRG